MATGTMYKKKTRFKLNKSILFFLSMLGLLIFLGYINYIKYKEEKVVKDEKTRLAQQIQKLENENLGLSKYIAYVDSVDFKEKAARSRLDLKKEGEEVFSFVDSGDPSHNGSEKQNKNISNLTKWKNYFFPN